MYMRIFLLPRSYHWQLLLWLSQVFSCDLKLQIIIRIILAIVPLPYNK